MLFCCYNWLDFHLWRLYFLLKFIIIYSNWWQFFLLSEAFWQNFRLAIRVIVFFGLPLLYLPILWQSSTSELSKLTFVEFRIATAVFSNSSSDILVGISSISKLFLLAYYFKELFLISNWITLSSKQLTLSLFLSLSLCLSLSLSLSVSLSLCLPLCLSVYLSVSLSLSFSVFLSLSFSPYLSINFKLSSCNRWIMTSYIFKISSHSPEMHFCKLSSMLFKASLKLPASFFPLVL